MGFSSKATKKVSKSFQRPQAQTSATYIPQNRINRKMRQAPPRQKAAAVPNKVSILQETLETKSSWQIGDDFFQKYSLMDATERRKLINTIENSLEKVPFEIVESFYGSPNSLSQNDLTLFFQRALAAHHHVTVSDLMAKESDYEETLGDFSSLMEFLNIQDSSELSLNSLIDLIRRHLFWNPPHYSVHPVFAARQNSDSETPFLENELHFSVPERNLPDAVAACRKIGKLPSLVSEVTLAEGCEIMEILLSHDVFTNLKSSSRQTRQLSQFVDVLSELTTRFAAHYSSNERFHDLAKKCLSIAKKTDNRFVPINVTAIIDGLSIDRALAELDNFAKYRRDAYLDLVRAIIRNSVDLTDLKRGLTGPACRDSVLDGFSGVLERGSAGMRRAADLVRLQKQVFHHNIDAVLLHRILASPVDEMDDNPGREIYDMLPERVPWMMKMKDFITEGVIEHLWSVHEENDDLREAIDALYAVLDRYPETSSRDFTSYMRFLRDATFAGVNAVARWTADDGLSRGGGAWPEPKKVFLDLIQRPGEVVLDPHDPEFSRSVGVPIHFVGYETITVDVHHIDPLMVVSHAIDVDQPISSLNSVNLSQLKAADRFVLTADSPTSLNTHTVNFKAENDRFLVLVDITADNETHRILLAAGHIGVRKEATSVGVLVTLLDELEQPIAGVVKVGNEEYGPEKNPPPGVSSDKFIEGKTILVPFRYSSHNPPVSAIVGGYARTLSSFHIPREEYSLRCGIVCDRAQIVPNGKVDVWVNASLSIASESIPVSWARLSGDRCRVQATLEAGEVIQQRNVMMEKVFFKGSNVLFHGTFDVGEAEVPYVRLEVDVSASIRDIGKGKTQHLNVSENHRVQESLVPKGFSLVRVDENTYDICFVSDAGAPGIGTELQFAAYPSDPFFRELYHPRGSHGYRTEVEVALVKELNKMAVTDKRGCVRVHFDDVSQFSAITVISPSHQVENTFSLGVENACVSFGSESITVREGEPISFNFRARSLEHAEQLQALIGAANDRVDLPEGAVCSVHGDMYLLSLTGEQVEDMLKSVKQEIPRHGAGIAFFIDGETRFVRVLPRERPTGTRGGTAALAKVEIEENEKGRTLNLNFCTAHRSSALFVIQSPYRRTCEGHLSAVAPTPNNSFVMRFNSRDSGVFLASRTLSEDERYVIERNQLPDKVGSLITHPRIAIFPREGASCAVKQLKNTYSDKRSSFKSTSESTVDRVAAFGPIPDQGINKLLAEQNCIQYRGERGIRREMMMDTTFPTLDEADTGSVTICEMDAEGRVSLPLESKTTDVTFCVLDYEAENGHMAKFHLDVGHKGERFTLSPRIVENYPEVGWGHVDTYVAKSVTQEESKRLPGSHIRNSKQLMSAFKLFLTSGDLPKLGKMNSLIIEFIDLFERYEGFADLPVEATDPLPESNEGFEKNCDRLLDWLFTKEERVCLETKLFLAIHFPRFFLQRIVPLMMSQVQLYTVDAWLLWMARDDFPLEVAASKKLPGSLADTFTSNTLPRVKTSLSLALAESTDSAIQGANVKVNLIEKVLLAHYAQVEEGNELPSVALQSTIRAKMRDEQVNFARYQQILRSIFQSEIVETVEEEPEIVEEEDEMSEEDEKLLFDIEKEEEEEESSESMDDGIALGGEINEMGELERCMAAPCELPMAKSKKKAVRRFRKERSMARAEKMDMLMDPYEDFEDFVEKAEEKAKDTYKQVEKTKEYVECGWFGKERSPSIDERPDFWLSGFVGELFANTDGEKNVPSTLRAFSNTGFIFDDIFTLLLDLRRKSPHMILFALACSRVTPRTRSLCIRSSMEKQEIDFEELDQTQLLISSIKLIRGDDQGILPYEDIDQDETINGMKVREIVVPADEELSCNVTLVNTGNDSCSYSLLKVIPQNAHPLYANTDKIVPFLFENESIEIAKASSQQIRYSFIFSSATCLSDIKEGDEYPTYLMLPPQGSDERTRRIVASAREVIRFRVVPSLGEYRRQNADADAPRQFTDWADAVIHASPQELVDYFVEHQVKPETFAFVGFWRFEYDPEAWELFYDLWRSSFRSTFSNYDSSIRSSIELHLSQYAMKHRHFNGCFELVKNHIWKLLEGSLSQLNRIKSIVRGLPDVQVRDNFLSGGLIGNVFKVSEFRPLVPPRVVKNKKSQFNHSLVERLSTLCELISLGPAIVRPEYREDALWNIDSAEYQARVIAVLVYLLALDKIDVTKPLEEELLSWDEEKDAFPVQSDYLRAYIYTRSRGDHASALEVANRRLKSSHMTREWTNLFLDLAGSLTEIAGSADTRSSGQEADEGESASPEKAMDATDAEIKRRAEAIAKGSRDPVASVQRHSDTEVELNSSNLVGKDVRIRFWGLDAEYSFSTKPFAFARGDTTDIDVPITQAEHESIVHITADKQLIAIPEAHVSSLSIASVDLVESSTSYRELAHCVLSSTQLRVIPNQARALVRVLDVHDEVLPRVYVKVYAKYSDGTTVFYKDSFTDMRGLADVFTTSATAHSGTVTELSVGCFHENLFASLIMSPP